MANARPRLFTHQEIIESFYIPGSDDEGNSDGEMLEDDREDETDVREDVPASEFDLQIEREAAQSELSAPRSRSNSDVGMSSQDSCTQYYLSIDTSFSSVELIVDFFTNFQKERKKVRLQGNLTL